MKDGAVFGNVDPVAGQHAVAPRFDLGGAGQGQQQIQGFRSDAIFGIIQQHVAFPRRKPLETGGVAGEQLAHVDRAHGVGVGFKLGPFGQRRHVGTLYGLGTPRIDQHNGIIKAQSYTVGAIEGRVFGFGPHAPGGAVRALGLVLAGAKFARLALRRRARASARWAVLAGAAAASMA